MNKDLGNLSLFVFAPPFHEVAVLSGPMSRRVTEGDSQSPWDDPIRVPS